MQPIPNIDSVYRHHKGNFYRVLMVVRDSTNAREGRFVVIYVGDAEHGVHARDLDEWNQMVTCPDGEQRRRFEYAHD